MSERPKLPPGCRYDSEDPRGCLYEDQVHVVVGHDGDLYNDAAEAWEYFTAVTGIQRAKYEAMERAVAQVNRGIEKCGDIIDAYGNDDGAVMAAKKILAALSAGEGVDDGE